ncbi:hypothetical protein JVT61DRAFT_12030 [Boletus reticuloceps]|uniref:Uncharacterized protein n=1 Tax=Boletus reticuloceps TaxID=495285 RepID=A0A8I3A3G4_9AGAM|nr:hypothetical protein JVT61DRAFT_12030 [Boletus reticuloceps]
MHYRCIVQGDFSYQKQAQPRLTNTLLFAQQSEARFVIFDTVTHPNTYTSNDNHVEKKTFSSNKLYQHVFEVAFRVYIEDIKEFIKNTVQKELEPLSHSRDFAAKQSARERRVLLKMWMAARYPLGYEAHEIAQLIAVLAPWQCNDDPTQPRDRDDMAPLALPAPPGGSWSCSQFVDTVVKGASKWRVPPFIQHGMFKHTISEAMELVGDLIRSQRQLWSHDPNEARDLMKAIMVKAIQELKINHVPWVVHRDGPCAQGQPSTQITHTVWLPLGGAEPKRLATMSRVLLNMGRTQEVKLLELCNKIALRDALMSWSATRQRLTNYHNVLHNQCLPSEWSYKNASIQAKDTLSKEVYTWLPEAYDPVNKPLHALTKLISIVFSGMLPRCFPPSDFSTEGITHMPQLADILANMPWESCDKRGATIAPPFITMITTFIIAIMDPESPFHRCKDLSCKKMFISKHSEYPSPIYASFASHD